MTPDEIIAHTKVLQKQEPGFSNYKQLFHDCLTLIVHLAENQKAHEETINAIKTKVINASASGTGAVSGGADPHA